ncbi:MAG: alpha/beta fold hydrolase [Rhodococcus sp. (in: high G+C Gram-positive bacteria)]|uniref:alpha/beta fold hydrolase n=1 Tax=Rhodococcus sp. TaxID=1831 RepID=UPI002AD65364|nr:alpha/beta fold hydrolase [Rhodococcus sp. (in: high G+C Gram-positive bacteria)]
MNRAAAVPPIRERRIQLGSISTRVLSVQGPGPSLLLLHGYTDSADTWRPVMELLATRGRRAIAIDLPHHGRAGRLSKPATLAGFDGFLAAALRYADHGDGVVVIGNSLGALLAVRAAHTPTHGLLGVLALAPPGDVIHPVLRALPTIGPALARALTVVPIPDRVLDAVTGHVVLRVCTNAAVSAATRRAYTAPLDRRRLAELLLVGAEVIPELGPRSSVRDAAIPLTLWWGSRDKVCPVRGAEHYADTGHTVITRGAPHCPQLTDPHLVLSLLNAHEQRIAQLAETDAK